MESFLQLSESEGNSLYINHSWAMGKFVTKDEDGNDVPLDFEHLLIHPDFRTGYGKFDDGHYKYVWDQQVGVRPDNYKELVAQEYKRAFSARVYIKDKGVYLWQRHSFFEGQAFDEAVSACWKDKVEGKVPCFKYVGSEKISFSGGASGFKAKLEYVKWVDKPADFDEPSDMGSSEARTVTLGEGGSGELDEELPF